MLQNILNQRINGFFRTQYRFHLPQFLFAFLNNIRICILCHDFIFRINKPQNMLVQLQMNDTAFIINWLCSAIFYRLCHIINIYVIPKNFRGAFVFGRNGRTCKANIGSIWQILTNDARCTHNGFGFDFSLRVFLDYHFFRQTILPTVRLVRHNYNISSFGKGFMAFLKFLHGRKNNAVCLTVCQKLF